MSRSTQNRKSQHSCNRLISGVLRRALRAGLAFAFLFASLSSCFAADVVLIPGSRAHPFEEETVRQVADFYGLTLHTIDLASPNAENQLIAALRTGDTVAVLGSQDALAGLDGKRVRMALRRPGGSTIPVMVYGVTAGDANVLRLWSDEHVQSCTPLPNGFRPNVVTVADGGALTGTLSGLELPAVASPACRLETDSDPFLEVSLRARAGGPSDAPVLLRVHTRFGETFFTPRLDSFDESWRGDPLGLAKAFSSVAPFMLFLSYAAGDYGWHAPGHYANLTIDDAWLTHSYGHLAYADLLPQMDKHNFHTTVAFIPWNFDRSQPDVVALFRAHPERFSVSIHGNDHAHREFGDYKTNSLQSQIADIKQGLARMERFHILTGIPYDRFMIFPHGVAPELTFAELGKYEFLGTANASNVPMGAGVPRDPLFLLRPYTLRYGNFPSFLRYPATIAIPRLEIAIHSFLGNPLLFYGHEDLFNGGIGAFNPFADYVNHVQPNTQWTGLGEIARCTYLIRRRRAPAEFDVWMMSNEADVTNPTSRAAVFYVTHQEEDASPAIRSFAVDGSDSEFVRSGNGVTVRLVIPPGQGKKLRLVYRNDLDLAHESIRRRNDPYSYFLRRISDFRDLYLSRFSWGRSIRQAYYRYRWDSVELWMEQHWWLGALFVLFCAGIRYRRHRLKNRALERRNSIASRTL